MSKVMVYVNMTVLGLGIDFHRDISYGSLGLLFLLFRRLRICRRVQKILQCLIKNNTSRNHTSRVIISSQLNHYTHLQFGIVHNTVGLVNVEIKGNSCNFVRSVRHQEHRKFKLCSVFVRLLIQHLHQEDMLTLLFIYTIQRHKLMGKYGRVKYSLGMARSAYD